MNRPEDVCLLYEAILPTMTKPNIITCYDTTTDGVKIDWGISDELSHRLRVLMNTRKAPLVDELKNVYSAPSTMHGTGVFTAHPVKKDDILTYYPADYLCLQHVSGSHSLTIVSPATPQLETEFRERAVDYCMFLCSTLNGSEVIIFGDPTLANQNSCLGHMINDGCKTLPDNFDTPLPSKAEYDLQNQLMENCETKPLPGMFRVAVRATKDIPANTELFCSYGYSYWTEQRVRLHDEGKITYQLCFHCAKKSESLLYCARCHKATYCNKQCQRTNWRRHKQFCCK